MNSGGAVTVSNDHAHSKMVNAKGSTTSLMKAAKRDILSVTAIERQTPPK